MQIVIDIPEELKNDFETENWTVLACAKMKNALHQSTPLPNGHGRKFEKIVVDYPAIYVYPEYKGKPYFSIQYEENGEHFIGYGTYKPDVLSQYLREYFIVQATAEADKEVDQNDN